MISEGSCNTEDWSKFCFAIIGILYILKYIKIVNGYFKQFNNSQVYLIF